MLFKKTTLFLNRCSEYGALFKNKTVFLNTLPCAAEDVMRKDFFESVLRNAAARRLLSILWKNIKKTSIFVKTIKENVDFLFGYV